MGWALEFHISLPTVVMVKVSTNAMRASLGMVLPN